MSIGIFTVQLEDVVPDLVDISLVMEPFNFDSSVFILNVVVTHSIASCIVCERRPAGQHVLLRASIRD